MRDRSRALEKCAAVEAVRPAKRSAEGACRPQLLRPTTSRGGEPLLETGVEASEVKREHQPIARPPAAAGRTWLERRSSKVPTRASSR